MCVYARTSAKEIYGLPRVMPILPVTFNWVNFEEADKEANIEKRDEIMKMV